MTKLHEVNGLKIEFVNIKKLKSNPKNRNQHSQEQIDRLAKIIQYQGWRFPIVVDKNHIIWAGHGRVLAAKQLGQTIVPVSYQEFTSEEQAYAFLVSDNAIASWAELDLSGINSDLGELGPDFNIDLLGIKDFVLEPADKLEPGCDEDDVPEHVEPKTKLGDIYQLGRHRLMCGDSTMLDQVEKLVNGSKIDMVFTDPPYGVNFEQGKFIGRNKKAKNRDFAPIANDDKKGTDLTDFVALALSNAATITEVCSIYVWSPPLSGGAAMLQAVLESGWHVQSQIVWNKTPFVIGSADYHWKHEICWYGYKGKNHIWEGGRNKATVWDVARTRTSDSHPTMKPVQLGVIACENSTRPGGGVLDLFGGSGSTMIAAEQTGRTSYLMELDPHYCDVIVARWEKYTGQKAELIHG